MLSGLARALGAAPPSAASATFADGAPTWPALAEALAAAQAREGLPAGGADLENGPPSPLALTRRFGTSGTPALLLYRDHAAWCPYCHKIVLQLEEKRVPYRIEKINVRSCQAYRSTLALELTSAISMLQSARCAAMATSQVPSWPRCRRACCL
jgi:glutathione S-transferase